jgi:hypothetical protein
VVIRVRSLTFSAKRLSLGRSRKARRTRIKPHLEFAEERSVEIRQTRADGSRQTATAYGTPRIAAEKRAGDHLLETTLAPVGNDDYPATTNAPMRTGPSPAVGPRRQRSPPAKVGATVVEPGR